jgi:hypothetical protein
VRFLGSGASMSMLGALLLLSVGALVAVAWPSRNALDSDDTVLAPDAGGDEGAVAGEVAAEWPERAPTSST